MSFWPYVCNNILLPLSDIALGNDVYKELNYLKEFQNYDKKDIRRYQDMMFYRLVSYLQDYIPFYRDFFKTNSLSKEDFRSIENIKLLPVLTKSILKDNKDDLVAVNYRGAKIGMKSSGSTGTQTEVYIDRKINSQVLAAQLLFWEWGGFHMGTPHLQTGMSLQRGIIKRVKDVLFRCCYVGAFGLDDDSLKTIIDRLQSKNIKYVFGYASSLYVLARYCEANGVIIRLNKVFCWGDCLFPEYRACIEKVFSVSVHDCYGLGEGLQVAAQCSFTDSLHVNQAHLFVEITDSSGQVDRDDGELGRVLVTRFEGGPMPLVRYDTGDLSTVVTKKCACGTALQSISRVYGRDTDIVISPEGDRLIVHFFTQLFEMVYEIKQFQVRQEKIDELLILYVPTGSFNDRVLEWLKDEINRNCKYKFKIIFIEMKEIPLLDSNKRRFVVSELGVPLF